MKIFRWRRFSDPGFLGRIAPTLLREMLAPFGGFFATHRVVLSPDALDYDALSALFVDPAKGIPEELIETLYYLDEVSIDAYHDDLATALQRRGIVTESDDLTTSDMAVMLWLRDRAAVERMHAEQFLTRNTRFDSYVTRARDIPQHTPLSVELEERMAEDLERRFRKLKKGGAIRVYGFQRDHRLCLVIRHGGAYQRDLKVENNEPRAVAYRPIKHGILIYYPDDGELAVHADGQREVRVFVEAAGERLFGSELAFIPADAPGKYTLKPFVERGADALDCSQCDGVDSAQLVELRWRYVGAWNHRECHTATDVFAAFNAQGRAIPHGAQLVSAEIAYRASRSVKPRRVRIRPPNVASYERDSDADLIEPWLRQNGFIHNRFTAAGIPAESFWASFDRRHELVTTREQWKAEFGATFVQLEPLLIGANLNLEAVITPIAKSPTPTEVRRVVKHADGSRVAVAEEPGSDPVPISKSQTAGMRLDLKALGERLAQLLGLDTAFEAVSGLEGAWRIGLDRPQAGVESPVVLVKPRDTSHLDSVLDGLIAREMTPAIVLVPTRRVVSGDLVHRTNRAQVSIEILDEFIEPDPRGWFSFTSQWPAALTRLRGWAVPSAKVKPVRFPTPADATWRDVVIRFVEPGHERVSICVKHASGTFTPIEMGMLDGRRKTPDSQWELLKRLAHERTGGLSWNSRSSDQRIRTWKKKLCDRLREFFALDGDPIVWDRHESAYRWRFTIVPYE